RAPAAAASARRRGEDLRPAANPAPAVPARTRISEVWSMRGCDPELEPTSNAQPAYAAIPSWSSAGKTTRPLDDQRIAAAAAVRSNRAAAARPARGSATSSTQKPASANADALATIATSVANPPRGFA